MPRPTRDMPPDFPIYAAREGNLRLRKRFSANGRTIERWRREIDVRYAPIKHVPKAVKRAVVRKANRTIRMRDEVIEDLDDGFDIRACVRSGGYGDW